MILVDSILLVDDDESSNFMHKLLINHLNVAREVFSVVNGREALEFIEKRYYSFQSLPSLILLDLNMPEVNGFDFLKRMLDSRLLYVKNIPVAILTSSDLDQDINKVKELGDFTYVLKPLREEKLLEIIMTCCNSTAVANYQQLKSI